MRESLATFLAESAEAGGQPRYVERDFVGYLECGVLARGFARVRAGTVRRAAAGLGPTLVLTAAELVKRLVGLIPPRGTHLICFHGVFAPAARLRPSVIKPAPLRTTPTPPLQVHPSSASVPRLVLPLLLLLCWKMHAALRVDESGSEPREQSEEVLGGGDADAPLGGRAAEEKEGSNAHGLGRIARA